MKWNNIKTTVYKELRGIIRDKKSLQKLILYPLLIPFIILLFGVLFETVNESVYVVGTNYGLSAEEKVIINDFDNIKFKNYNSIESLKQAYDKNEIEGYIVKEGNKYTVYTDESENSGSIIQSLATTYLELYNKTLGNNELIKKGINPDVIYNAIQIENVSLAKEDTSVLSNIVFSLIITYIIMIIVMVCVVVVTDATSGEKERGTLETILTFPIKSSELVLGKYLATAILGFIIGLISYILSVPTFIIAKKLFESYDEIVIVTSFKSVCLVILVIFLVALLSAGICMALAGKTKTYKEAQSSLQFISLLPMIPYFLKIMEVDNEIFNFIPIANCGFLLNDIVVNNIKYHSLLIIIVTTVIYTTAVIIYISRQYKKEETLFS